MVDPKRIEWRGQGALKHAMTIACSLALILCLPAANAQSPARLFHSGGMYSPDSGNTEQSVQTLTGYNPVPVLWPYDPMANGTPSARARNTYLAQHKGASEKPPTAWRTFFAPQNAATVIGGTPSDANDVANTLAWFQKRNYPVDYVFADFEGYTRDQDWSNTYALINQVRSTPVGANTAIGNYDWFPGPINLGADYPWYADRRTSNAYYPTTATNGLPGLTVAMPVGYPLQQFIIHADDTYSWGPNWWGNSGLPTTSVPLLTYNQQAAIGSAYLSPNERAGMFYAPLEQVSSAKRSLPAGHQLIPWVSAFQFSSGLSSLKPGQVPTPHDNEALLEHFRLRGADGYFAFGYDVGASPDSGTYTDGTTFSIASTHAYAADMIFTWKSLDWFFNLPSQVGAISADGPLNLYTFKNTGGTYADPAGLNGGIEWSAYRRGNRILALISNLGNGAQAATGMGVGTSGNWQTALSASGTNLAPQSPIVPAGQHLVLQFLTNPTVADFGAYGLNAILGPAQGWQASAANFVIKPAAGSGDGSNQVVAVANGSGTAWFSNANTVNPGGIGATANDTMMYSFKIFTGWSGNGNASFAPVVGSGSAVPVPVQQDGPTLWVFTGNTQNYWGFGSNLASAGPYHSTNFAPLANTWYAVEMIVNPATDLATIYATNLTTGNGTWTLLQFVDTRSNSGGTLTSEAAGLTAGESPSLYNGFQISGSAGAQFDEMSAQLYPYPISPLSSYSPAPPPPAPPSQTTGEGGSDAPLPKWATFALAAGILGIASRKLRTAA